VISTALALLFPPTLLRDEIRVLLTSIIEVRSVLVSMETSVVLVSSQLLRIVLHSVVELIPVFLIRVPIVTSMVALVLLHREMRVI
jgi:hypothetical protein